MNSIDVANGLSVAGGGIGAATSSDHSTPQNPLGAVVSLDDGRKFKYVQFSEAMAIGMSVTPLLAIDDADVDSYSAAAAQITATGDFTANEFQYRQAIVWINAGTGAGQSKRIVGNTANVLSLDSAFATALDATSDYVTIGAYRYEQTDAAGEQICGVVLSAQTADYFGWIQVAGVAFMRAAADTDNFDPFDGVVASSTSGVAKGLTQAGVTAAEAAHCVGYFLGPAYSTADSAGVLVPVLLSKVPGA